MATFGPTPTLSAHPALPRPVNFASARLQLQQRALGTLAHELGNLTSPIALVADVVDTGTPAQARQAATTLRLVAAATARATTVCRLLRGNTDTGAFAPATIPDTAAWWTLCAPYVADNLPGRTRLTATVDAVSLHSTAYEALVWATIALSRLVAERRPSLTGVAITGTIAADGAFTLRIATRAPRDETDGTASRQLLTLSSWEIRRVGGRVLLSDTPAALECRITVPPSTAGVS